MGLKHGKYVYIQLEKGKYVKARVLKGVKDTDPEKYIVVGPLTKKPPYTAKIVKVEELPSAVREKVLEDIYKL